MCKILLILKYFRKYAFSEKYIHVFVHLNVTDMYVNMQNITLKTKSLRYIKSLNECDFLSQRFCCGNILSNFVTKITEHFNIFKCNFLIYFLSATAVAIYEDKTKINSGINITVLKMNFKAYIKNIYQSVVMTSVNKFHLRNKYILRHIVWLFKK